MFNMLVEATKWGNNNKLVCPGTVIFSIIHDHNVHLTAKTVEVVISVTRIEIDIRLEEEWPRLYQLATLTIERNQVKSCCSKITKIHQESHR